MTPRWHAMTGEEAERALETSVANGLSEAEAAARRLQYGPNALREKAERGAWRIFVGQFADFMILVLLAAGAIAGILGERGDALAIAAIVVLNAVVGFVQEYRAERAMQELRKLAAQQARVVRGGVTVTLSAEELVPGDVVLLEAGNTVPADLRLAESIDLLAGESALTGESMAVEKTARAVEAGEDAPLGDRASMAYKGTAVVRGRGRGLTVATGMATELGKIASLLERTQDTRTPLQRRLAEFGRRLAIAAVAICAAIVVAGVARGEPVVGIFLTGMSLAVAAIPESLPAVVTIALALGARRMLRLRALVRKLPAVETLGAVTYICTDKTGTLTENRMRVAAAWVEGLDRPVWPVRVEGAVWDRFFSALALNNDAARDGEGWLGDPTETALVEAADSAGYRKEALEAAMPRVDEIPFDSARSRMTTVHGRGEGCVVFTKGSPESVLPLCAEGARLERLQERAAAMAGDGLRVLAVADREAGEGEWEDALRFLGFVGLIDPPRAEAKRAVAECKAAGIVPVMITGDHPATARAIAVELEIAAGGGEVITGREWARLDAGERERRAGAVRVYARVNPEQKLDIVDVLQRRGEIVAMTGDGVNDAPALQQADIGVAMGRVGTDVARESADLVLLDDNFATIVAAVREGRHIFDNVRKFMNFVMASNAAEILTIFLAPFFGLPVPLLPIHILWTNLVTDGLPGLALAAQPEEEGVMRRAPRRPDESIFARGMWQHMIWVGVAIAGFCLLAQAYALRAEPARAQTLVFTILTMTQMAHVLAVRWETAPIWRGMFANPQLLGAVALTVGLQAAVTYLPACQTFFRTVPLSGGDLALAAGCCALLCAGIEVEKMLARRGWIYTS